MRLWIWDCPVIVQRFLHCVALGSGFKPVLRSVSSAEACTSISAGEGECAGGLF